MTGALLAALAAMTVGACGGRAAGTVPDGGSSGSGTSFDVTATLTPVTGGPIAGTPIPSTAKLTLSLDVPGGRVVAGADGLAAVLPMTTTDGKTFTVTGDLRVGLSSAASSLTGITYREIELTVAGKSLQGHAKGGVEVSCGDCFFQVPFTAELRGVPDVTAPYLVGGPTALDPFSEFGLGTSEPLAASSRARLVGGDGFSIELTPELVDASQSGGLSIIRGFTKPKVVLPPGSAYAVEVDGLVDLAGRKGAAALPTRLGTFPAPPLATADGFESLTAKTFGGGAVVTQAELAAVTGTRSIYLATIGGPGAAALGASATFTARLAVPSGARTVKFSYAFVSSQMFSFYSATVGVGSPGHEAVTSYDTLRPPGVEPTGRPGPGGTTIYVAPTQTASLDLPADVTGEILVGVMLPRSSAGPGLPASVLLDDLRVE